MNQPASAKLGGFAEALYALAFFGAHVGFMPLLVLLLPRRVEALGSGNPAEMLSWLLLSGGVTASLGHIIAGHWSDHWKARWGSRRGLIAIGMTALVLAYLGLAQAKTFVALLAMIVAFQLSLNVMFAPLGALLADYISNERKGRVAGMMNAALPLSYAVISLIAWLFPQDGTTAFLLVAAILPVTVLPLLLSWPFGTLLKADPDEAQQLSTMPQFASRDFALAWLSRLLVQLGAGLIISYLFLYVSGMTQTLGAPPTGSETGFVGQLSFLALVVSFFLALAGGHVSDIFGTRRWPLAGFACLASVGLALMAWSPGWLVVALGYGIFNAGLTGFLSVDSALMAQIVSGHRRLGALLGVVNLTNTLPAILVPGFALLAVGDGTIANAFLPLQLGAAIAALLAAVLILQIRSVR
jgi:MFS family permease